MKAIACSLIAVGLGWTFAEVRRFFFHSRAFYSEAIDDYQDGRTISLICGVGFIFVGALIAFHAFGLGVPVLSWNFPYVVAGSEARRFLIAFCSGLAVWGVLSAASTRLLPPPLFSASVAALLCRIVRGSLLLLLTIATLVALRRIGDNWRADGFGALWASHALFAIYTGKLWPGIHVGRWEVPPVTCADRPFPFVASVLISIAFACFLFTA